MKDAKYYIANKDVLKETSNSKYRNLSVEEKEAKKKKKWNKKGIKKWKKKQAKRVLSLCAVWKWVIIGLIVKKYWKMQKTNTIRKELNKNLLSIILKIKKF